jgi:hypothetical protein
MHENDIIQSVETHLKKHWTGKILLLIADNIRVPVFILKLTAWAAIAASWLLDPLLLVASIYLMASVAVPAWYNQSAHNFFFGIVTGAPDIIIIGGVISALLQLRKGIRGTALVIAIIHLLLVTVLAGLTGYAYADIYKLVRLSSNQEDVLFYWRSMTGIVYSSIAIVSIVLEVKEGNLWKEETETAKTVHARLNDFEQMVNGMQDNLTAQVNASESKISAQVDVHITSLVNTFGQQVNAMGEEMLGVYRQQIIPQVNALSVSQEQLYDRLFVSVQNHVDARFDELKNEVFQQIEDMVRLMDNLNNGVSQVSHVIRKVEVSVSEVKEHQSVVHVPSRVALPSPQKKVTKQIKQSTASKTAKPDVKRVEVPELEVDGVSQEVANRILTDYLVNGLSWRNISGNYMKSVKPVKDAYELYLIEKSASGEQETEELTVVDAALVDQSGEQVEGDEVNAFVLTGEHLENAVDSVEILEPQSV